MRLKNTNKLQKLSTKLKITNGTLQFVHATRLIHNVKVQLLAAGSGSTI